MTNKAEKDYQQAIDDDAQRIVNNVLNGTEVDRQLNRRAAEILLKKFAEEDSKNPHQEESGRLGKLNQSQFTQELRDKYGIY